MFHVNFSYFGRTVGLDFRRKSLAPEATFGHEFDYAFVLFVNGGISSTIGAESGP